MHCIHLQSARLLTLERKTLRLQDSQFRRQMHLYPGPDALQPVPDYGIGPLMLEHESRTTNVHIAHLMVRDGVSQFLQRHRRERTQAAPPRRTCHHPIRGGFK